ncbi:MAG: hypothetical protein RR573_05950 [Oscillospiraceae bacterium]
MEEKRAKKRHLPTAWHKLDNTANVFPVVASKRMTNVFRISAVLNENIDADKLQEALEITLPYFAAFCVRLRHGLFWSYFETNTATPSVEEDKDYPCRYIDPVETGRYLFRVLYFENRIHLEVFHALTDGTGAIRFLRALCYQYIKLTHRDKFTQEQMNTPYGVENAGNTEDGYLKCYVPTKASSFKEPKPFHMHGETRTFDSMGVSTALFSVNELKKLSHAKNASITEFLAATLAMGIYETAMSINGAKKPINLFVPVNLRKMFPSETSLNFFSNITVTIPMHGTDIKFDDVLAMVKSEFALKLNKEYFSSKLVYTARSETNMFTRIIPLPLKNSIIRIIYEHSSHCSTMSFSNLGPVEINAEFAEYFKGFRFLLYAAPIDPIKCAAVTCADECAMTFTTIFEGQKIAASVLRRLAEQGLHIEVESNGEYDETL